MSKQEQEHIELYGNQRFKLVGQRIVAVEQKCFHCQQTYWQPVISFSPDASQIARTHQCTQSGAAVINKFG